MSYQINPLSILILPKIDEVNNYKTILYEAKNDNVSKVSPFGYWILHTVYFNPGSDFKDITRCLQQKFPRKANYQNEQKIRSFFDLMVSKEVIFQK